MNIVEEDDDSTIEDFGLTILVAIWKRGLNDTLNLKYLLCMESCYQAKCLHLLIAVSFSRRQLNLTE